MEEEKVPMMEDSEKGDAMEEKKNEDGRPEPEDEDFCECCCGKCQCHDPTSRKERCCCCMPLRCGVNWIILLTIAYVLLEFITIVMLYQNVYFEWYYPTILLLLLAPAFVALAFFLNYWCGDSKAARSKLGTGCILLAASAGAIAIWEIIYFSCIYKYDVVYVGYGEPNADTANDGETPDYNTSENRSSNYVQESMTEQIVEAVVTGIVVAGLYFFWMFSMNKYANTYDATPEPKKDDKKDESMDKKSEKME